MVFYQLLTGRKPFEAANQWGLAAKIIGEGGITRADMVLLFDAVVEHGALGYSKLVDFRQTEPAMSGEEMLELGVRARALHGQGRMGALALVLPDDRGAEAEPLIGMVSVADRPMRIFRDLGQATRWLDGQKPATEKSPPK